MRSSTAGGPEPKASKGCNPLNSGHRQYWRHSLFCCCTATGIFSVFLAIILLPIIFVKIVPEVAQHTLDHAQLVLTTATIKPIPGATDSITLEAQIVVYETGVMSGTVEASKATVYDPLGRKMGTLGVPEMKIVGGQPLKLSMSETFECTDREVFQASIREMTKGNPQNWQLVSDTTLHAEKLKIDVNMNKTLPLPAMTLLNPVVTNFDMTTMLMDIEFYCMSDVHVESVEKAVFNTSDHNGVVFGTGTAYNMTAKKGYNIVKGVKLAYFPEPWAVNIGLPILHGWYEGENSVLGMAGPVSSSVPLLENIFDMKITFLGKREKPPPSGCTLTCPTSAPTRQPTSQPTNATAAPTSQVTTAAPTSQVTTAAPTAGVKTEAPTSQQAKTEAPTTQQVTTEAPTTHQVTTEAHGSTETALKDLGRGRGAW